nr:MAG TPA: hypothetical protein [Caudoviricetes sp.]
MYPPLFFNKFLVALYVTTSFLFCQYGFNNFLVVLY